MLVNGNVKTFWAGANMILRLAWMKVKQEMATRQRQGIEDGLVIRYSKPASCLGTVGSLRSLSAMQYVLTYGVQKSALGRSTSAFNVPNWSLIKFRHTVILALARDTSKAVDIVISLICYITTLSGPLDRKLYRVRSCSQEPTVSRSGVLLPWPALNGKFAENEHCGKRKEQAGY